jgi:hypothetical protein
LELSHVVFAKLLSTEVVAAEQIVAAHSILTCDVNGE